MDKVPSIFTRILPPITFVLALFLLVFICQDKGFTGLPPVEKRYLAAKTKIYSLKEDIKKANQREPWEKLAQEFNSIYESDPSWPNRPAALYKAAESLEELSRYSCSRSDARKAINTFEAVALRHASSRLADDALYRAARLRAATLKDDQGALNLIERIKRQYPNGDMIKDALALEKALLASAKGKRAPAKVSRVIAADKTGLLQEDYPVSPKKTINFKGDLPFAYKSALKRIETLKNDKVQSCWRQPWEKLRNDFLTINKAGKTQLAAGALYHAALCQEKLGNCSRLDADLKKASDLYLAVKEKYATHPYADDALLQAAKLQRRMKKSRQAAVVTIKSLLKAYPSGDAVAEAKKLLAIWTAEDSPQLASISKSTIAKTTERESRQKGELQILSWNSLSANSVDIALDLSKPVKYDAQLLPANKSQPTRLIVDLKDTVVIDDIKKGVKVNGSLLKNVKVKTSKNSSLLEFDFKGATKFETVMHQNPPRLVLSVVNQPRVNKKADIAQADSTFRLKQVNNIASQLGLTVHTVFIDAGHGGKDPGANHNKVIERNITLDIARRLGNLLKANGLQVIYSREKDVSLPLSKRTEIANKRKADLFISIHVNAHSSPSASGFETYFLNLASNKQAAAVAIKENAGSDKRLADLQGFLADIMLNARIDESKRLAQDIQRLSIYRLKKRSYAVKDSGVKSAPFHVLLGAQMPAVLIETGYCTNANEAKNLLSPDYRHALAEGIAEGILAYRDRLIRNRTADSTLTDAVSDAI